MPLRRCGRYFGDLTIISLTQACLGYTAFVGSLRFDGVLFVVYSNDHPPRHVHGFFGGVAVVADLRCDGNVSLTDRNDAIRPANAKRSDVRRVLDTAAGHFEELITLWEGIHGKT